LSCGLFESAQKMKTHEHTEKIKGARERMTKALWLPLVTESMIPSVILIFKFIMNASLVKAAELAFVTYSHKL
ncbi:hypothetical protein ACQP3L_39775, partial [Escherichia coli]